MTTRINLLQQQIEAARLNGQLASMCRDYDLVIQFVDEYNDLCLELLAEVARCR